MARPRASSSRRGGALGTVIINLQQTEKDGKASLRVFAKCDEVMLGLLRALGPSAVLRRGIPCTAVVLEGKEGHPL